MLVCARVRVTVIVWCRGDYTPILAPNEAEMYVQQLKPFDLKDIASSAYEFCFSFLVMHCIDGRVCVQVAEAARVC